MKYHYNYELCRKCGGICCSKLAGAYLPKDIIKIFGSVEGAIKSDKVAIDWLEGRKNSYYMRPKTIHSDELYDPSWGGKCIHLKDYGCELSEKNRPSLCKALKPVDGDSCRLDIPKKFSNDKFYAVDKWKKSGIDLGKWR